MSPVLFSHANGFPPKVYREFLNHLEEEGFQINAIDLHQEKTNWYALTQKLISFVEDNSSPPIAAIGHSLGGVLSLFALALRPKLFNQVIAIDPPFLGAKERWILGSLRLLGLMDLAFSLPAKAKKRKNHFSSREDALTYFQGKAFFKNFHPSCLKDYTQYGLAPTNDGHFELVVPPHIEEGIFRSIPCFFLPRLSKTSRATVLYACPQGTPYNKGGVRWMAKALGSNPLIPYDGGHMAPLEQPEFMAKIIGQLLNR